MKENINKQVAGFYVPVIIVFLTLIAPHLSWAWGTLEGYVLDGSGTPLDGALVQSETDILTLTHDGGYYNFGHPAGNYNVTASASGYAPQTLPATVTDSITTVLDFDLSTLAPPPKIESVTPNLGGMEQDLEVTITGADFDRFTRIAMNPDTANMGSKIGSLNVGGKIVDIQVTGNLAYMSDNFNGLKVVDISDPTAPESIGSLDTLGSAGGLTVVGDIIYLADGYHSGLWVIDISDPTNPSKLATKLTNLSALDVTVVGDIAYIADAGDGLYVLDVSNPSNPVFLGSEDTPDWAQAVTVVGDIAYVADDDSGLQLIDVSDPSNPAIIGTGFSTPGKAFDVEVINNIAYVAAGGSGLQIIDVSNPASPTFIGSIDTPGEAHGVTVIEDIVYVSDRGSGLRIIDASNPAAPLLIGAVDTMTDAFAANVIDKKAFIANGASGLEIFDVSSPSVPTVFGSLDIPAGDIYIVENTAYVTGGTEFNIIDITNPATPVVLGTMTLPDWGLDVTVVENTAYVAARYSGLLIIDVSIPASPTLINSVPTDLAKGVTIDHDYAFVADGGAGLKIIDISVPADASVIGTEDTYDAYNVYVLENTAYIADRGYFTIIDITDRINPTTIGSIQPPGLRVEDVVVVGNTAYVANHVDVLVIDVSDPANPTIINSIHGSYGDPIALTLIGNTIYVADTTAGIQMIDITVPTSPVLIGTVDTPNSAGDVSVAGNTAYVAEGRLTVVPTPIEITTLSVQSSTEITATLPSPEIAGNYTLRAFNNLQDNELFGAVTFTNNVDLLHARAILVAGGGPAATGDIWEETKSYIHEAYDSLIYQGYRPENIFYLTDEAAAVGRDAGASPENLQYAITDWADDDPATKSLVVYMVDHGEDGWFQIRGNADPAQAEYVTASELNSWLDTLQAESSIKVLLVYDACHSGSFIDTLRDSDDTRVVITSVDEAEVAYFLDLKQSFSGIFWGALSGKTGTQGNLYNAWNLASDNMANYQTAQLDANGNGVTNEPEDIDAIKQNIFEIGRQWFNADFSRPVVNGVAVDQTINGTTSASLSAWGIYDLDQDDIVRVWAEIIAPDHVPGSDATITSLPSVDLADLDEDDVYTAVFPDDTGGAYTGFDTQGTYIINYYAEDSSGVYSEPKTALVTQQGFSPVLIPDQYEDDDTADRAQVIVLNSPTPQEHSFHDTGDKDWVVFYGLSGEVYSVRTMNPTIISDPVISIYSSTNFNTPLTSSNSSGMGVEEQLKNWTCPADGLYYVQISNNSGHYGANVRYKLKIYNPIAFSLPGYVKGKITSGGQGVAGAVIRAGGGTAITLGDGSFILCLEPGSYSVSVSCDGYQSTSFSVNLDSGQSVSLSRDMNSVPRILNFPSTVIKANEDYSYVPSVSDADGDPLSFSISGTPSWANFSTANGRLWGRPGAADQGSYGPITIKVSDNAGASDSITFTIKVEQGTAGSLPGVMLLLEQE